MTKPERRKVTLGELHVDEETFQPRDFRADGAKAIQSQGRSNAHVKALADSLKQQGRLDPLTTWRDPQGKLWVIDGHHRHKAYLRAWGQDSKRKLEIVVLECDRSEAIRHAFRVNSKDRLSMTRAQKSQAAWRLIADRDPWLERMSDREAAKYLPVTHETIRKMRRTREILTKEGSLNEFTLWRDVCSRNWDSDSGRDLDAYREEQISKLEMELSAPLSKYRGGDPSIVEEALERAIIEAMGLESRTRIFHPEDGASYLDEDDF